MRQLGRRRPHRRHAGLPAPRSAQLQAWGFEVVLVDVSEFHLGGGSVRCLTNPLDITLGGELQPMPGGRVIAPPTEQNTAA